MILYDVHISLVNGNAGQSCLQHDLAREAFLHTLDFIRPELMIMDPKHIAGASDCLKTPVCAVETQKSAFTIETRSSKVKDKTK